MAEPTRRRRVVEIALLYGATLVVTVGLTLAQGAVGWLRAYLLVIVAATFLYLPIEVLHRRGEDPEDLGIHRRRPVSALKAALWLMLLTFPPYLLGFHGWQTQWLGREAAPAEARLDRWPVALQEAPRVARPAEGDVWLYTETDAQHRLRWRLPAGQRLEAEVVADGPLRVVAGGHQARADGGTLTVRGGSVGMVAWRTEASALTVDVQAGGDRLPADRLRLGTALTAADTVPYRAQRGWWWLLNLVLVQFLLVAVPEEVFYRGYLQSRLDGLIGRDRRILGADVNVASVLLTSALFAVGHIATIPHPSRLAVFFPSLLFGWLRRRSGGVLAPAIYHAACNLLVDLAVLFYR
ncbi:MAG: CPBP family intramembrane metalloprotease [Myxococcales bacterium]|nr:CPBP family intramembrane metalloprotease [Myxococcales bacterium]